MKNGNVTLFGRRVFKNGKQLRTLRWNHPGLPGLSLKPMAGVLLRTTQKTHGPKRKRPHDHGGRNWSNASCTSQATPRFAGSGQKLGERNGKNLPSEPPEGTNPADMLACKTGREQVSVV